MKPKVYFVAGTDTGVGKSLVSAAILQAAIKQGWSTVGLKPLAAGCEETSEGLRNEDALLLQQFTTLPLTYEQINPVSLRMAVAPHIAAIQEGRRLDVSRLEGFCRAAMLQRADLTLIEGAGGWRVPINARHNLSHLVQALQLPVILVVGIRLGCISHALLTAEAIQADGLQLAGWVANQLEANMPFADENIRAIEQRLDAPCVGIIPFQPDLLPHLCVPRMAICVNLNALL